MSDVVARLHVDHGLVISLWARRIRAASEDHPAWRRAVGLCRGLHGGAEIGRRLPAVEANDLHMVKVRTVVDQVERCPTCGDRVRRVEGEILGVDDGGMRCRVEAAERCVVCCGGAWCASLRNFCRVGRRGFLLTTRAQCRGDSDCNSSYESGHGASLRETGGSLGVQTGCKTDPELSTARYEFVLTRANSCYGLAGSTTAVRPAKRERKSNST